MQCVTPNQPFIYLAPIKGLTDAPFRQLLCQHFGGFNATIAPFISPQKGSLYKDENIRDVLPQNNTGLPVIPQLLHTDPEDFLVLAHRLTDIGYTHINWNLGCPAPMIVRKKRGSGLLPYPQKIINLLTRVLPELDIELSIKTRLGFYDHSELHELLLKLNHLHLKEIIIHSRLGKQMYTGPTDPDAFAICGQISKHILTYNGDIVDVATFTALANRLQTVDRWMIGRGALANPFLAEEINGYPQESTYKKRMRLYNFHKELYDHYLRSLSGSNHTLGRLKRLWIYLIASFPGQERSLKKILNANRLSSYRRIIEQIFTA